MASITSGRVKKDNLTLGEEQVAYYSQRASAGLIISEGTWINKEVIGFINVPEIYNDEQVKGWRKVTESVHLKDSKIFCQLGHTGSLSHPEFQKGELPVAPLAININMQAFTSKGLVKTVTPRALFSLMEPSNIS